MSHILPCSDALPWDPPAQLLHLDEGVSKTTPSRDDSIPLTCSCRSHCILCTRTALNTTILINSQRIESATFLSGVDKSKSTWQELSLRTLAQTSLSKTLHEIHIQSDKAARPIGRDLQGERRIYQWGRRRVNNTGQDKILTQACAVTRFASADVMDLTQRSASLGLTMLLWLETHRLRISR